MAEGGGDRENPFNKDFNKRPHMERQLSRDDIGNQARFLLGRFIHDRMVNDGIVDVPDPSLFVRPETPAEPPVQHLQHVAGALRRIGDELDGDNQLQSLISQISPENPRETFVKVAMQLFSDGNFNWGRVVALFYFAYKIAVKTFQSAVRGSGSVVRVIWDIIDYVVSFIVENVAQWIIARGGWEAIQEYFGTPSGQFTAVILTGILTGLFVYWYRG